MCKRDDTQSLTRLTTRQHCLIDRDAMSSLLTMMTLLPEAIWSNKRYNDMTMRCSDVDKDGGNLIKDLIKLKESTVCHGNGAMHVVIFMI